MRFWQKVFLSSLALVLVGINVLATLMIGDNHRSNVEMQRMRAVQEHALIMTSVQAQMISERFASGVSFLDETPMLEAFAAMAQAIAATGDPDSPVYLELYAQGERLYSIAPMPLDDLRASLGQVGGTQYNTLLHDYQGHTFLFVASIVRLENRPYTLVSIRDVSFIFTLRARQMSFFADIGLVVSAAVAGALLLLVAMLSRPLERMEALARRLAQGDYSRRMEVRGRDELAALGESFNNMAEAVQRNVQSLEAAAEDRQRFIENLTHEMKTPLTSIIGFSDLLRSSRRVSDDKRVDFAHTIYSEGQHLKALSSRLMELILLGRTEPDFQSVDMENFLLEIARNMEPVMHQRALTLKVEPLACTLRIDAELIRSLLHNLLDNASKASDPDSVVELAAGRDRFGRVTLRVTDYGHGMPPSETRRVLQPFYMLDKARTRSHGGAGLGLALCAQIAQVHGAQLSIRSAPGKGTTVTVAFPLQEDT